MMMENWDTLSTSKKCLHCTVPLTELNDDYHTNYTQTLQDFNLTLNTTEIPLNLNSTTTREWLKEALFSIFKLNYLNAFDGPQVDELESFSLCHNCSQVLKNLHQLYNDFLQLGELDSYLNNRLQQLDKIIDRHQEKSIHCDLITIQVEEKNNCDIFNVNEESTAQHSLGDNDDDDNSKSNISPKSTSLIQTGREPLILLTRLPAKYGKLKSPQHLKEEFNRDSSNAVLSNDDYSPLQPEVKIEVQESDDDDGNYLNSLDDSNSSADYTPKLKRRKSTSKKSNVRLSARLAKISIKKVTKNSPNPELNKISQNTQKVKKVRRSPGRKKKEVTKNVKTTNYLAKRCKYPNPCWYCKRTNFSTPSDCVEHTREEHLPKKSSSAHICQRCARICVGDMSFSFHIKRCELIPSGVILPKKFQCLIPTCAKSFFTKDEVNKHMIHHSTDRPFQCDECPYRAKIFPVLKAHKKNMHSVPSGEEYKCDDCGKVLKSEKMLKWHKGAMHTSEGYQKYKEQMANVQAKLKQKKRNVPPPSTICVDCNVDLFARLALINHRRTFHEDNMGRELVCEKCGVYFTRAHSLKIHTERVHSDERPFICEKCGKGFKRAYNLKAHDVQTHTEEGRLKYNQRMRESNRRMKLRAKQLATNLKLSN